MRYKTAKNASELALSLKILIPTALMFLLFIYFSYFVVIPMAETRMMDQRRELLRSVGTAVWHILDDYHQQAVGGELPDEKARAKALAALKSLRFGPDAKSYFWVNDFKSVVLMHPYRAELVGTPLTEHAAPSIRQAFTKAIALVKKTGEGFVEYQWQWQDDPPRIAPKQSFVKLYEPWGWMLGTGFYVQDVQAEIALLTRQLFALLIGVLAASLAFCFYIYQQANAVDKQRKRAEGINRVLIHISNAVNTTFDLEALYRSIHRSLGEIIDVTNFFIALYDPGGHNFIVISGLKTSQNHRIITSHA